MPHRPTPQAVIPAHGLPPGLNGGQAVRRHRSNALRPQEVRRQQVRYRDAFQPHRAAAVGAQVQDRRAAVRRQRQRRETLKAREGAQVDAVALLGGEVGDRVGTVTGGEHERIGARTARQAVRAAVAVQLVVTAVAVELVVAAAAVERVIVRVRAALQHVVAAVAAPLSSSSP